MTQKEKQIEDWWDNLTTHQQDSLEDKFFKKTGKHLYTLENVVECYEFLSKEDLLIFSGIKENKL
jgi:hypothetical protein